MSTTEHIAKPAPPFAVVMAVYLCALLIGGLYVGIVSPVRTVVQSDFGIGDELGIWMITIYALFYAAWIPVIGKLGDRHGRKLVLCVCLGVFALGALLCGLSGVLPAQALGGYPFGLLLAGRVVQAVGASGVIPVANAEIGVSAPPDKRGMALGITAGVMGLSNAFGAAVGSAMVAVVGVANWSWIFLACIPLCLLVLVIGAVLLPSHSSQAAGSMDLLGSALMVAMVLCLLLGIQNADLHEPGVTPGCWIPLAAAVVLLVLFLLAERRASDPVFHLEYFQNRNIIVLMVVSFFVGWMTMSFTIMPEFVEFALEMPVGTGGVYMMVMGVFSMVGPPLGGRMTDRMGARMVMIFGLLVATAGYGLMAMIAPMHPTPLMLGASLGVMGLGMGFAIGGTVNYMILEQTDDADATTAIATVSLVRQMGISLSPSILVSMIVSQGGAALGYQHMLLAVAGVCLASAALMLFYRSSEK